jgi:hypothetical protein
MTDSQKTLLDEHKKVCKSNKSLMDRLVVAHSNGATNSKKVKLEKDLTKGFARSQHLGTLCESEGLIK